MNPHESKRRSTLESLQSRLTALPLLPAVVAKLLALDPAAPGFFEEVVELARQDPPFATRLLRLANSASVAPLEPVTSLQLAVSRVGARRVAGLVTSLAVLRVFVPTNAGQRLLWTHSIETGVAAEEIARLAPELEVPPEHAYLCGLMHDIGRFILFQVGPQELGLVDETGWSTPAELIAAEKAICGFDHAELGWHACAKWKMPELVVNLVRHHHVYVADDDDRLPPGLHNLVKTVQMADFLSLLCTHHPDITDWSVARHESLVHDHCVHPGWTEPPVGVPALTARINEIQAESRRVIARLGLGGATG